MKAHQAHAIKQDHIASQLSHLQHLLREHARCEPGQELNVNWSQAGDLTHVSALLQEAIEFLGGDINAARANKFWTTDGTIVTIPQD